MQAFNSCLEWGELSFDSNFSDSDVTETQYIMYELAAAVALKNSEFISARMARLPIMCVSHSQILAIARIAAVISTFTKIVV